MQGEGEVDLPGVLVSPVEEGDQDDQQKRRDLGWRWWYMMNDDDDIVEERDGDGLPAYVPASACQRWREGADDEAKQGRVAHHLQVFCCWLMRMNCACFLLKGSRVNESFCFILARFIKVFLEIYMFIFLQKTFWYLFKIFSYTTLVNLDFKYFSLKKRLKVEFIWNPILSTKKDFAALVQPYLCLGLKLKLWQEMFCCWFWEKYPQLSLSWI